MTKREKAKENQRETVNHEIDEVRSEMDQLEREKEVIEERMSLRDRVKKYGFTVFAVATAVGVVISVVVSNLKKGLTSVANGVGNGLRKKIGDIVPGMIGAIASFIFKTAGDVVGLAVNSGCGSLSGRTI